MRNINLFPPSTFKSEKMYNDFSVDTSGSSQHEILFQYSNGIGEYESQHAALDARGAAHARAVNSLQLYQAGLEHQLVSLHQDKQRVMTLNQEMSRRMEEAGIAQSEKVRELQQMVEKEQQVAKVYAVDHEHESVKRELARLEVQVESHRMHIKELLFTQKLERNEHANHLLQKEKIRDERDEALATIRQLSNALAIEQADRAFLQARLLHSDASFEGLVGRGDELRNKALHDLNTQLNNLQALNEELWARVHTSNKALADASERHALELCKREASSDQLRARIATLTEEQSPMWDQAAQVTMRSLAKHHRELLHNLEVETLKARAAATAGEEGAADKERKRAAGAPAGAPGVYGGPADKQAALVGGVATLLARIEGLRQTMQKYAVVGEEMLGKDVDIARLKTCDVQSRSSILALEAANSSLKAQVLLCPPHPPPPTPPHSLSNNSLKAQVGLLWLSKRITIIKRRWRAH